MKDRFKVIISNQNLYKEIELAPDMQEVRVGTSMECGIKLRKELFFSPVELTFRRQKNGWNVVCSDSLYFTSGDVRKLFTKNLIHGDELLLKYQESDNDVMSLSYMIDFDYESKDYDLEIDISGRPQLTIGGANGLDMILRDPYLGADSLSLKNINGRFIITDNNSRYGVFVNGKKINRTSEIKDRDFFSIVGFSFYYKKGKLYTSCANNIFLNNLPAVKTEVHSTHFTYPEFSRNTRIQFVIPEDELEIKQAEPKPQKSKKRLLLSLIPSLVMLVMIIILRGIIGGGGTYVIYSAVCMGMGIITSIITYFSDKKEYTENTQTRIDNYNKYIEEKRLLIENSRNNELRIRNLIYESLENSLSEAGSFGRRLFERERGDADFLQIYLGRGRVESANQVKFDKPDFIDKDDPLATIPEEVSKQYKYIENAPVVSDANGSDCIGITGPKASLLQLLKNITLDLSIRHFYGDVKIIYITDEATASALKWTRWLHNVENTDLNIRNIACDAESRNMILEDLYAVLSSRENLKSSSDTSNILFGEQYVVFVTDAQMVRTHPISRYFEKSSEYAFTFIFLEEYEEFLPQGCNEIIRITDNSSGYIFNTHNGDKITGFCFPLISDAAAKETALKLGGVTVDEVSLESELTKNITMFEMLGILSAEDLDLEDRWSKSQVYKSLSAPIGVKRKGRIVSLDIGDKASAHGPHGLVAGTTGSGKSEVLQTYILSMATLYHPYEVGFVIIDFKGGGMANQFKNLPHLIGTITNIDGREINRSLLSIKAELVKRQEMFSDSGVNHINDYIKLFRAGKVTAPMPHLIIIVDEFAELKAEYPDFMKELISAARIGRTLGVHLILATQKPAGVVDAQIWSNSKFRICLKVQTKEDSKEVIKTPLAAEIVEAGRGYFQVGNNEIFDLFQSAYSGADVPAGNESREKTFAIFEKNLWGRRELKYTNRKAGEKKESVSQLQAIVDHVNAYCLSRGIKQLPGICLPSLEDRISAESLDFETSRAQGITVPVGIFDDPNQQKQGIIELDLAKDNTYLVGSSQMGKTVFLQTLVYGLIRKYTPQQVNIYLIDCGSMVLKIFEDSAHVGGVVLSNEEEKCKNLFRLLSDQISQRKKILSGRAVGNYSAYLEAGYTDMPLIVVAIDNMGAFREYFPNQSEMIGSLAREAIGVGISLIITSSTSNALLYRIQANFGTKLVLNCNDTNEYSTMLGRSKTTPKETAGRGLFILDKRVLEFQTAIFGKSSKEAERNAELKEFIAERNSLCTAAAPKIPMVPDRLILKEVMAENTSIFRNPGVLPIGMSFASVKIMSVDINTTGSLSLLGDAESRTVFTKNFIKMIAQNIIFHNIQAYIVDDKSSPLEFCSEYGFVREYTANTAEGIARIAEFCDLAARYSKENEDDENRSHLMLIINSMDVFKRVCADKNAARQLTETLKGAVESGVFILFGAVENQVVSFNASELLKAIKEERQAILFAQLTESKMFDIAGRVKPEANFDSTMGYRLNSSTYSKIKIFE